VISFTSIPNLTTIRDKTLEEIGNLAISQVKSYFCDTLSFTLTDGQTCKSGTKVFTNNHTFDPTLKITKVEVIIHKYEVLIMSINFYSAKKTLIKVGGNSDEDLKRWGGRIETFEIAADERLIGCKLD
jgi:hypothetical protein